MTHPYLAGPAPLAMAHRGGAREAPENSLRAFRNAVRLGYTHIETDIRATADGVPVVFHDESLQRVTDRVGRIRDLPFAEVKKAHIGNAERVHSLQEVLDHFPGTHFNIDIKEDNAVRPVIDLLARGDHLDRVCVASFSRTRVHAVAHGFRGCGVHESGAPGDRGPAGPQSAGAGLLGGGTVGTPPRTAVRAGPSAHVALLDRHARIRR